MTSGTSGGAMPPAGRTVPRWILGTGLVAVLVLTGATAFGLFGGDDDRHGEVVRVIDGDTLIALIDGEETTIRLLNIDTPETKDPDESVQCLGPEASAFLAERLPAGTPIELEYDEERLDRYDRTLAGVSESESLVDAEIAEAGLGAPVYFAPNDRFLREVEEASERAQENGVGLFSEEIECTLPGQLQAQSAAVEQVPATVAGDPADALAGAAKVLEDLEAFIAALDVDGLPGLGNTVMTGALLESYLEDFREEAEDVRDEAEQAHGTLDDLKIEYDIEQERLEEERLEEERREQERLEREEREREEREERERQEREEQERRERERQQQPAPSTPSSGGSSSSSGSGGGSSSGGSSGGSTGGSSSGGGSGSSCVPYGPEIPYSDDGGYTGKRYGMPGGKTFRKCN